jgi:hypothetical protein
MHVVVLAIKQRCIVTEIQGHRCQSETTTIAHSQHKDSLTKMFKINNTTARDRISFNKCHATAADSDWTFVLF